MGDMGARILDSEKRLYIYNYASTFWEFLSLDQLRLIIIMISGDVIRNNYCPLHVK